MATTRNSDRSQRGKAPRRTRLPAAERRETILRAAAEVFADTGYRAAKVSDVAARIGVTEPVIFQNFGSKAALFAAVVERAAAEVRASLDDLAAVSGSASGLLSHVLSGLAHGHPGGATADPGPPHPGTEYGVLFADAATLAAEAGPSEPALDALRAVAAHLADLIQRARSDGGVHAGTDPEAAAWLLLSVLSARRLRAAAMPAGLEPAVAALTLRALTPPAATARDHAQTPADQQNGCHPDRGGGGMLISRTTGSASVVPELVYPDVAEAADWLCGTFGFTELWRADGHRARLAFGNGVVILADADAQYGRAAPDPGGLRSHAVMVKVDDVDAHHDLARQRGARIVSPPADYPYGERQYAAEDLAGHHWTFTQAIADLAPEDWGGTSNTPAGGQAAG